MTFEATLEGYTVTRATVTIPASGAWWAEVAVDVETELVGAATLRVGDLDLVGTLRPGGGGFGGASSYRLEAGAGSWGRVLPARGYRGGAPVKLSTVLADLAGAVGETVAPGFADADLGTAYVRPAGPAYRALDALVGGGGWWVRPDGSTSLVARSGGTATAAHDVIEWVPGERLLTVATMEPAAFGPGATVEVDGESVTLGTVVLELGADGLRLFSWCVDGDPLADALAAVALRAVECWRLLGVYEYRLVLLEGGLASLQPTSSALGLPVLRRVPWRPGLPGAEVEPSLGSLLLVAFVNGDRARPFVVGFEGSDGPAYVPGRLALDADAIELGAAVLPVARYGDTVTVGSETGVLTFIPPPGSANPLSKVTA